jgi:hypothetical protein
LHITALAADLPDAIEVDVSSITEINGAIHVSDLPHCEPPDQRAEDVAPSSQE